MPRLRMHSVQGAFQMKTRDMATAKRLGMKATAIAVNGWRQFFHYAIRFHFREAWNELMSSKEQVKLLHYQGDKQ